MADKNKREEAENAILDRIIRDAGEGGAEHLRALAEAFGWVRAPSRSGK